VSRIAGQRPPRHEDAALTVDYADVLRQAVDNERWRVLRDVLAAVERVGTTTPSSTRSYGSDPRNPDHVKSDILAAINRIGDRP
jgi:hypothetical protein